MSVIEGEAGVPGRPHDLVDDLSAWPTWEDPCADCQCPRGDHELGDGPCSSDGCLCDEFVDQELRPVGPLA